MNEVIEFLQETQFHLVLLVIGLLLIFLGLGLGYKELKVPSKYRKNSLSIGIVIFAIATILGIYIFLEKDTNGPPEPTETITPFPSTQTVTITLTPVVSTTPTQTFTPTISIRPAVQALEEYYEIINNAANTLDLEPAWDYISEEKQEEWNNGDIEDYTDFWWDFRIRYRLFDCEINVVDVELTWHNRSDEEYLTPLSSDFIRYTFEVRDGQWVIIDADNIEGSSCEPYN